MPHRCARYADSCAEARYSLSVYAWRPAQPSCSMPIECRFHHAFPACQATSVTGTSCTTWPRRETTKCAAPAPPRLTILGDSVLTAVEWNDAPLATLQHGFDVYMDIAVCRRIAAPSCPYEGGRVPTLMDVINAMGVRLGPTVLVEVGYNDELATFSQDVDTAIQAMLHAGVQHILWANFPATSNQSVDMDHALEEVASHYGQMTIVDWNGYSRGQGSWFQNDGIHLLYPGALAMATLFNQAVTQ